MRTLTYISHYGFNQVASCWIIAGVALVFVVVAFIVLRRRD